MPSGVRQPLPWEDRAPEMTRHDLEARPVVEGVEVRTASALVGRRTAVDDTGRRGAEGAAAWVFDALQREGDITASRDDVRDRVNRARETCRRKRED